MQAFSHIRFGPLSPGFFQMLIFTLLHHVFDFLSRELKRKTDTGTAAKE